MSIDEAISFKPECIEAKWITKDQDIIERRIKEIHTLYNGYLFGDMDIIAEDDEYIITENHTPYKPKKYFIDGEWKEFTPHATRDTFNDKD